MNDILVTIGIPCYNVEKFVAWAIKSVLAQSYTNFELIITDDGSTDRTVEILREFKDDRIILIVDGENHGISYRLNQQIDMAKGDYFFRMDGDDIMFPDRVEKQVKFLKEHPEIDVIGSSAIIIDDNNQIIGKRGSNRSLPTKPEQVVNTVPFMHPTVAGRIAFFKKYHYDEDLNGVEDKDLWCRGAKKGNYDKLVEPLMFYRDPFQFKISTYLFRQKQARRQIIKRRELLGNKGIVTRFILVSYFKSIVSSFMFFTHLDKFFIMRRNQRLLNTQEYTSQLDNILNQ